MVNDALNYVKLTDIARSKFETRFNPESLRRNVEGDYLLKHVQDAFVNFLNGFSAVFDWDTNVPSLYIDKDGVPTIDLDKSAWEAIKTAANESEWMPEEYAMNDWVADVCRHLRKGVQFAE